jgi:hypothetical protein
VFHFDGKFLKSSRYILTNPGFLTKEFNAGRRVRYAQPLRLYVFASFLFFAISALTSGNLFSGGAHAANAPGGGGWLDGLIKVNKQPGELVDQTGVTREFEHLLPEMFFLCVPFLALALKLVYRRSGRVYVEHLIFALHLQAFCFLYLIVMFSAMSLAGLAGHGAKEAVNFLFAVLLAWMIFRAFRTVYGQGAWRTLGHMALAGFLYWVVVALGMVLTAVVSFKLLDPS